MTMPLYTDVSPSVDSEIKRLCDELRLPQWAVIEQAIKTIQYDENGKPIGWTIPDPNSLELPIPAA
ncbi:hypothetical protein ASG80_21395 [Agromyces sp. Soil535]|nr:hypothetical protein ASG80_21395 [Agromyces sp. Soil535]